eukprot:14822500-Ditylum_brightwellii.AAC.1
MEGTPSSDKIKAMAKSMNSKGGGMITGKKSDKCLIMSNSDSPYTIGSNEAATIFNAMGLGVYTDLDWEHLSTSKLSIIGDNSTGESMQVQTPAEKDPKSLLSNFKSSNIDLKPESFLHTAMDTLIQDMTFNSISPTLTCSTVDSNGIVEEDLIVVWNNVLGELIYAQ